MIAINSYSTYNIWYGYTNRKNSNAIPVTFLFIIENFGAPVPNMDGFWSFLCQSASTCKYNDY